MREIGPAGAGRAGASSQPLPAGRDRLSRAGARRDRLRQGHTERPEESLGRTFLDRTAAILEPGETATRQIACLGYSPKDVRHIVLTHLDLDHTGGLRVGKAGSPTPRSTSTTPSSGRRWQQPAPTPNTPSATGPRTGPTTPHWVTY